MLLATQLYERGKLSFGQPAEIVGLTKRTFAELLGKYNVSFFNCPASDLTRDIANAYNNNLLQKQFDCVKKY